MVAYPYGRLRIVIVGPNRFHRTKWNETQQVAGTKLAGTQCPTFFAPFGNQPDSIQELLRIQCCRQREAHASNEGNHSGLGQCSHQRRYSSIGTQRSRYIITRHCVAIHVRHSKEIGCRYAVCWELGRGACLVVFRSVSTDHWKSRLYIGYERKCRFQIATPDEHGPEKSL
jgi:hypothetical protein